MRFCAYKLCHALPKAFITTIPVYLLSVKSCVLNKLRLLYLIACTKLYEEEYVVVQKAQETEQAASVSCICHDELVSSGLGAM